jgi:polyisoprenoid-binding protein YceI
VTQRYTVSPEDSSLSVDARSTLHNVRATASNLSGYIEAIWNPDGSLAATPAPAMHVEFPIDRLRSGNSVQDREMRKLIDATRFPKVAADLRGVQPVSGNRYKANGDVTLAGRSRSYGGEFSIQDDGDRVTLDGELSVDMRDFGVTPPSLLFLKVDPILHVRARLVARKAA